MKRLSLLSSAMLLCFVMGISLNAQNKVKPTDEAIKNLKPYPEVIDSLERYVIYLDQKADESLFEIELIAGKKMMVDCNRHNLMGSFKKETLQGWGYDYYVFETNNHVASTMMMCAENTKTEKFITGESISTRYNSRLPIVVYLPKGIELKYRIWTAGEEYIADRK